MNIIEMEEKRSEAYRMYDVTWNMSHLDQAYFWNREIAQHYIEQNKILYPELQKNGKQEKK